MASACDCASLTCESETLGLRLKMRPENRRIHWVLETVADIRWTLVFDVHVEVSNVRRQKEIHNRTVVGKLAAR
jgi:hypothetical protein